MKKILLAILVILGTISLLGVAPTPKEQPVTLKTRAMLPAGWTVTEKAGGIKMYERAAQSLEIKDSAKVPGFMLTISDTGNTVPKDAQHKNDYHPYFEIYCYQVTLTEEQIIKYNRLANAMYNRPAGTQDEYPPRFAFQKGAFVVMKSPTWGRAASPDIDSMMIKIMSLVRKELP
jgi:hypothetical protein